MKTVRTLAFLLVLLLLPQAAMAAPSTTFDMMGFEEDETPRSWENVTFFALREADTGIAFTFREYHEKAAYQAAKDAAFANGDLPDVLFKAALTPEEEMRYGETGQLVDLAPYLEENAPNLHTILEARPDWRAIITQPDGKITSLPALNGAERQCCIWINKAWLDTLELSMPTTIEEFTDVLRAMRDGDPNGNGQADEIPLSIISPWEAKYLLHAWGIAANDYNLYVDDAGVVQFAPYDPAYRDFVTWLRDAVAEGLIDMESFRQTHATRSAMQTTNDSSSPMVDGCIVTIAPYLVIDMDRTTDYAVLPPLVHEGKQVYRKLLTGVNRGTFAVTSACTDVPAALRWVDYLYTEEGGRLASAGREGEDYLLEGNGSWKWNVGEDYTMLTAMVDEHVIGGDGETPGLEPAAFMRNSEIIADNYARRQVDTIRDMLVDPFPVTWPTNAGRDAEISALQLSLATYLDTSIMNFAMGKTELTDETWTAFLKDLQDLGADDFIALWQAVYDEAAQADE